MALEIKKGSGFVSVDKLRWDCYHAGMARRTRCSDAGYVYHVLNRGVGRATIFDKTGDYAAFEKILREAWERTGMRLLSYVLMPNHWHLVVWPHHDGVLSTYVQWLTVTHVRAAGTLTIIPREPVRSTRVVSSRFQYNKTSII